MYTGIEQLIEATGCNVSCIDDLVHLTRVCDQIVDELSLTVIGNPQWHQFPSPHGVTGIYLLSESHLTCHTFPEYRLATFNLYCCRKRPEWPWRDRLQTWLGASQVRVRSIDRGVRWEADEVGSAETSPVSERVRFP